MKDLQAANWGHVYWLHQSSDSDNQINIGIVTILPNKRQIRHTHFGDVQFLYAISGKGVHIIDDVTIPFEEGDFFYMQPGAVHETINISSAPLCEFLISLPVKLGSRRSELSVFLDDGAYGDMFISAVQDLDLDALKSLKVPITVFDKHGKIVLKCGTYPEFCCKNCNVHLMKSACISPLENKCTQFENINDLSIHKCKYGATVIIKAIVSRSEVLGYVRGGHFAPSNNTSADLSYDTPQSTINGVGSLLSSIAENIMGYISYACAKEGLKSSAIIQAEQKYIKRLKTAREKMLNLQINQHFLFNTLNSICAMAIEDGSFKTYEALVDLSQLMRYTLRTNKSTVTLKAEIEYLKNYVSLQSVRYKNRLEAIWELDESCYDLIVPFNFLQPLIENSFIHGFKNIERIMKLYITVTVDDSFTSILLKDNGCGMQKDALINLREQLVSENINGLSMAYSKLQGHYGNGFTMIIDSLPDIGTSLILMLPINIGDLKDEKSDNS